MNGRMQYKWKNICQMLKRDEKWGSKTIISLRTWSQQKKLACIESHCLTSVGFSSLIKKKYFENTCNTVKVVLKLPLN